MERRILPRIPSTFRVAIKNVDPEPVLRRGDISLTGIFVELDVNPGQMGMVQSLSISDESGGHAVNVMAQVVRVASVQDLWRGPVFSGAAFSFMAESGEKQGLIDALVEHAQCAGLPADTRGSIHEIVVEADWAFLAGESVRVTMETTSGRRVVLDAEVWEAGPHATERGLRQRSRLRAQAPGDEAKAAGGFSIGEAVGAFVEKTDDGAEPPPSGRFAGMISAVSLPGLLSFLEMQRFSGVLDVRKPDAHAALFICQGRVVDVELESAATAVPGAAIIDILGWTEGAFEFHRRDIGRPDRVHRATLELILEAARLDDESSR